MPPTPVTSRSYGPVQSCARGQRQLRRPAREARRAGPASAPGASSSDRRRRRRSSGRSPWRTSSPCCSSTGRSCASCRARSRAAATATQFDCTEQSPQPSQTALVDEEAPRRIDQLALLPAPALLGGAGLLVDQDRSRPGISRRRRCTASSSARSWNSVPAGNFGRGSRRTSRCRRRARRTLVAPSASTWRAIASTRDDAVDRLAAGHRDGVVEQDLVGDVGPRPRSPGGSRDSPSGSRCRRRGSGTRAAPW